MTRYLVLSCGVVCGEGGGEDEPRIIRTMLHRRKEQERGMGWGECPWSAHGKYGHNHIKGN